MFPKRVYSKWRSLGHQAMTFSLAPLTVIGPAWRFWLISKLTGLFRFNERIPKLRGWPSGHTNLPCPCFKSSCKEWHSQARDMGRKWAEGHLTTSDNRCFETSRPSLQLLSTASLYWPSYTSIPFWVCHTWRNSPWPMTNSLVLARTLLKIKS